ncbi:GNAT family N-acetyltransferase, partial [bacterium]|nr:GNAT family N-acetyltransferase [bacterium]
VDGWRAAYRGIVPDAELERLDVSERAAHVRGKIEAGTEEFHLALSTAKAVGFVSIREPRDEDVDASGTGEINGLYVAPAFWRQGHGRLLLDEGERRIRERGCSEAVLWVFERNEGSRRFYEEHGFAPDEGRRSMTIGIELPLVRYRKRLRPGTCAR